MAFIEVVISFRWGQVRFCTIDRLETGKKNCYTTMFAYRKFSKVMYHYNITEDHRIINSDINAHLNKPVDLKFNTFNG